MLEVKKYRLAPTPLIPNSPRPLLHYPKFWQFGEHPDPVAVYDELAKNSWQVQWIYRYGMTQQAHYHSTIHECMTVLSGTATIRFGVADTVDDLNENTRGHGSEDGGVEIRAGPGDVFIIPAGVAHKTFETSPAQEFQLLTPGNGQGIAADDPRTALSEIKLTGFTMIGAYPTGGGGWDFVVRDDGNRQRQDVWSVPKPRLDPVLGDAHEGLCGIWT